MPVPRDLRIPELAVALRLSRISAPFMPMPETAVHHHRDPVFGQRQIRPSRQFSLLQPESEPTCMQALPHQNLWFGILSAYA